MSDFTPTVSLVGRQIELTRLDRHLTADQPAGALLVQGPAGAGVTALIDAALERATGSGHPIVRVAGARAEQDLRFAGLHQLLIGLEDLLGSPEPVRPEVLAPLLGLDAEAAISVRAVVGALTDLIAEAARRRSAVVVVAVDDVQWLDRDSALVLTRLAARPDADRRIVLAGHAPAADSALTGAEFAVLDVAPLAEPVAGELLRTAWPQLAEPVRRRVLADAAGLPLALLELPRGLTAKQRSGDQPLPFSLALTSRLRALHSPAVTALPPATLQLLLPAALNRDGDSAVVPAAADLSVLEPAQRARLVTVERSTRRVRFAHPVVALTVADVSGAADVRAAHHWLAGQEVSDAAARIRHLAETALGPDGRVADDVERAARRARANGRTDEAVDGLLLAAEMSTGPADRLRRIADAAAVSIAESGSARIDAFWEEIFQQQVRPGAALPTAIAAALHLMYVKGDAAAGHALLTEALRARDRPAGLRDTHEDVAVLLLLMSDTLAARADLRAETSAVLADRPASAATSVAAAVWSGSAGTLLHALPAWINGAVAESAGSADPHTILSTAAAAEELIGVTACAGGLWRLVSRGRSGNSMGAAMRAAVLLARDAVIHGDLETAVVLAGESLASARQRGYRLVEQQSRHVLAWAQAIRGDTVAAARLVGEMAASGVPDSAALLASAGCHALGLAALTTGQYQEAYANFAAIARPGTVPEHDRFAAWTGLDLVEAAVRTGRAGEAGAHARALARHPLAGVSPRFAFLAAAATALSSTGVPTEARFEAALALPGVAGWPHERARVELAYGEWLRRQRHIRQARQHLTAAQVLFESLGSRAGVRKAARELDATGLTRAAGGSVTPRLTSQERAVAELAAAGLNNHDIGERLNITRKTVASHLYKIYPKLGIRSRAAISDALSAEAD